jgi:hypothetical protein
MEVLDHRQRQREEVDRPLKDAVFAVLDQQSELQKAIPTLRRCCLLSQPLVQVNSAEFLLPTFWRRRKPVGSL